MRLAQLTLLLWLSGAVAPIPAGAQAHPELARQVFLAESSFAATMADRDLAAFGAHLASDAIFLGDQPLRGKGAVIEGWREYFAGPTPPFSWRPELIEVLESGDLALSSGPVFRPDGRRTGTFNSIWRRDADGRWRVIFDKGAPHCPAAP